MLTAVTLDWDLSPHISVAWTTCLGALTMQEVSGVYMPLCVSHLDNMYSLFGREAKTEKLICHTNLFSVLPQ